MQKYNRLLVFDVYLWHTVVIDINNDKIDFDQAHLQNQKPNGKHSVSTRLIKYNSIIKASP